MLVGLFSILGGCVILLPSLLAIVLGHMATKETKTGERGGHGMAVTGLVTGYLSLVAAIASIAFLVIATAQGGSGNTY